MDKKCNTCKEVKDISLFNKKKDKRRKEGYKNICKACQSVWYKKWVKETNYKNNYYNNNKEKIKEKSREIYQCNKEKEKERTRVWKKNNREKINKWLSKPINRIKDNLRKYKRRGAIGKIEYSDWVDLCNKYENKCLCCGAKEKMTIDHVIPLILGGTNSIENVQPLCLSCNSKKGIKTTDYRL